MSLSRGASPQQSKDQAAYNDLKGKLAPLSNDVAYEVDQKALLVGWGISIDLDDAARIAPAVTMLEGLGATVTAKKPGGVKMDYQGTQVVVRVNNARLSSASI